jgi:hypothetical protein
LPSHFIESTDLLAALILRGAAEQRQMKIDQSLKAAFNDTQITTLFPELLSEFSALKCVKS